MSLLEILGPNSYNLYCNNFSVSGTTSLTGNVTFQGNLLPQSNNASSFGSLSFQWQNLYSINDNVSNQLNLNGASNQIVFNPSAGFTYSLNASSAPAASRVLSLYDPLGNCNIQLSRVSVVPVSATGTTLAQTQSGSLITVANAGGAYGISLPAVANANGVSFTFVVKSTLAAAVTITAASAVCQMSAVTGDAGALTAQVNKTNIILGTGVVAGDKLEYYSDGTNWYVMAHVNIHTAITTS